MDKIISVLEFIEDEPKTWAQIRRFCKSIDFDPDHAHDVLTDPNDPLVIERDSGVRPNTKGHQMVADFRAGKSSGNSIRIDKSTGVVGVIGNNNTINQNINTQQPVHVEPYTDVDLGLIAIGRWIMRKLFGDLSHNMRGYTAVTSVLTIAAGTPFAYPFITQEILPISVDFVAAIFLVAVLYLGWGIVFMAHHTTCPQCHQKFMFTRKKSVLVGERETRDKIIENYENDYRCDNCNYEKKKVKETVTTLKSDDD